MIKIFSAAVISVGLLSGTSAFAQVANTATTTASGGVTIIQPITIDKTADLEFGRIVKPASGSGTVTITNGSDVVTAASGAVKLSGITTSQAKFTIGGEGGQALNLTVPATFDISDGSATLTVTTNNNLGATPTLSNALASAGSASLLVGGAFALPATAATGRYTGTLSVTVSYQ